MRKIFIMFFGLFFVLGISQTHSQNVKQPNVILLLTDDQGIGELGVHGNPWIQTPNIDKFY